MAGDRPRWWARRGFAAASWLPFSVLFSLVARVRRRLYASGRLKVERLAVPVIVVGNIAVGGSGKTPVVAWLVEALRGAGWTPGVISRGYRGKVEGVGLVGPGDDPSRCGDEPVLLARDCACPVAVGQDRIAAAQLLLARHPECDVLVSDDGLQHYRLGRDLEIVVVDEAVLGNRWPLPAGPLREGLGRLGEADLLLFHGPVGDRLRAAAAGRPAWSMRLRGDRLVAVGAGEPSRPLTDFAGRTVHAIAGIGRPERFFAQLEAAGLKVIPHPFPDHHAFRPEDLAFTPMAARIMTAKDAVKCAPFALPDCWMLPVRADIPADAADFVLEKLRHGRSTA